MLADLYDVRGFDPDDEADQRASDLTDDIGLFEMPVPPNVGDIFTWAVGGEAEDDRIWSLAAFVKERVFHVSSVTRRVVCRLTVDLVERDDG